MASPFETTQWSVVLRARDGDAAAAGKALEQLCAGYWQAVYGFIRARVRDADEALDLTQGFFVRLLRDGALKGVDPSVGRFRSFLLGAVRHYLADERDRATSLKRGGEVTFVSLDTHPEYSAPIDPAAGETPEEIFERRWAKAAIARAMTRLEERMDREGKIAEFRRLAPYLSGTDDGASYREVAVLLGSSEGAVKVAVLRLRRRFGDCLKDEIAETVDSRDAVADELRYLIGVVTPRRR